MGHQLQSTQGVGSDTTIFVNPNGPFFKPVTADDGGISFLQVGPFFGGTIPAKATILVHELGHTINALPSDMGSPGQFMGNTNAVLLNCYSQVK